MGENHKAHHGDAYMSLVNFINKNVFFTTRSFAFASRITLESASRQLKRLKEEGGITLVTRGIWTQTGHPHFTPYGAVPFLLGSEQGYVSFLTALHRHDVISQIPRVIQIATTGHGRKLTTPIASYEFFHIDPTFMTKGIVQHDGKTPYNIATAEKALMDTLHLSTRKGKRFSSFPELHLKLINKRKLNTLLSALKPSSRTRLTSSLEKVLNQKI
jgi:predicted transcriptional regulator of viral defense system